MTEEKKHGIMDTIKTGLGYVSQILSASIFPPIADGAELVMKRIEERMMRMEKRILRKMSSLIVIGFGGVFLVLGLLFFLIEYAGWSNAAAFFSIGITVFVIGLLMKLSETAQAQ